MCLCFSATDRRGSTGGWIVCTWTHMSWRDVHSSGVNERSKQFVCCSVFMALRLSPQVLVAALSTAGSTYSSTCRRSCDYSRCRAGLGAAGGPADGAARLWHRRFFANSTRKRTNDDRRRGRHDGSGAGVVWTAESARADRETAAHLRGVRRWKNLYTFLAVAAARWPDARR
jgi:hypothetical protein